ncbi:hypothetical protein ABW19_dt0203125 [Dactylella cylindrospora]|nr:hypothetical protein ABW19_dt0203125 [Dactylella cylindrospora]
MSHLPLPENAPPPLPPAAALLHLEIPAAQPSVPSYGLPSPPPEYTEIAPGLIEEIPQSPAPRSERQLIRPPQQRARSNSTPRSNSSPQTIFNGPSYIFGRLVRADDYSGASAAKTTIQMEDITYVAGQRSLMIAINLIQQSPPEWLVDVQPGQPPYFNPLRIEGASPLHFSPNPPRLRGDVYRAIQAPPTPSVSSSYSPSESIYDGWAPNNFSRPSPPQQHMMYGRAIAPPSPPLSPSESPINGSRRPSISSTISASEVRMPGSAYERSPPIPPKVPVAREIRIRGAENPRDGSGRDDAGSQVSQNSRRGERQRPRRGPASWFSFGRN